ncbi:uncharacterized protein LOC129607783 [Condylostylus longicornis]|uniref:uncharacterized protein LOC129607783 n=1 Tax=Condylostylus longicornis TaxID=2530218 RepID=UPI00244E46F0|nr:uncharacterized protein LOC129607783 [Condylostylus longicornis]
MSFRQGDIGAVIAVITGHFCLIGNPKGKAAMQTISAEAALTRRLLGSFLRTSNLGNSKSKSKSSLSTTTARSSNNIEEKKINRSDDGSSNTLESDDSSSNMKKQTSSSTEENSLEDSNLRKNKVKKRLHKKRSRDITYQSENESLEKKLLEKSIKKKHKKSKRGSQNDQFSLVVTPVSTSALKFNKKIRKPQIRITIYDALSGKNLSKTDEKDDDKNLQYGNYFLTEYGKIVNFNSFSFSWNPKNSTVILDKEINYMQQHYNIIIFFEIIDNSNTITSTENSYNIAWFYDEWTKRKRKEYPGVLNIKFDCQRIHEGIKGSDSRKNSYQNIFKELNKLSIENSNDTDFVNDDMNLNQISKLNESHKFIIPEKMIFKSNFISNSKGSSSCALNSHCDLLAYTVLYNRKPSDIVLLDILAMKIKYILKGHEGFIHYLEWSNRQFDDIGEILLSCSEDQTCILWKIFEKSYEIIHVLFHPTFVYCGTFLIQNFTTLGGIITGGRDHVLRIWKNEHELNSLILIQELNHHKELIISVAYVFQSNKIYSADKSGVVIEWKLGNSNKFKWSLRKITPLNSNIKQFLQHSFLNRIYILSENFLSSFEIRSGIQQIYLKQYNDDDPDATDISESLNSDK